MNLNPFILPLLLNKYQQLWVCVEFIKCSPRYNICNSSSNSYPQQLNMVHCSLKQNQNKPNNFLSRILFDYY